MEMRYLKRENENGQEERFYPVTHAKAIVYGDDDKVIFDNIETHLNDTNNPHGLDCEQIGAAASSHNHAAGEITSGTLGVARGGTGATTFASGAALIGNGTDAVTTRAITNNTSNANLSGTNLVTANSVNYHGRYWLNRSNRVIDADTSYTTHMARGIALVTSAPSSLTNGCISLVY